MATTTIPTVFCIESPVFEEYDVKVEKDHQKVERDAMNWEDCDGEEMERQRKIINLVKKSYPKRISEDDKITFEFEENTYSMDYRIYINGVYFTTAEFIFEFDVVPRIEQKLVDEDGINNYCPDFLLECLKDEYKQKEDESESESDDEEEVPKVQMFNDVVEEDEKECPVCLTDIDNGCSYYRGCCGHRVCVSCFENMEEHNICRCPLCREDWEEEENDDESDAYWDNLREEIDEDYIRDLQQNYNTERLAEIIDVEGLAESCRAVDGVKHTLGAYQEEFYDKGNNTHSFYLLLW
jgi:hypothetical protein